MDGIEIMQVVEGADEPPTYVHLTSVSTLIPTVVPECQSSLGAWSNQQESLADEIENMIRINENLEMPSSPSPADNKCLPPETPIRGSLPRLSFEEISGKRKGSWTELDDEDKEDEAFKPKRKSLYNGVIKHAAKCEKVSMNIRKLKEEYAKWRALADEERRKYKKEKKQLKLEHDEMVREYKKKERYIRNSLEEFKKECKREGKRYYVKYNQAERIKDKYREYRNEGRPIKKKQAIESEREESAVSSSEDEDQDVDVEATAVTANIETVTRSGRKRKLKPHLNDFIIHSKAANFVKTGNCEPLDTSWTTVDEEPQVPVPVVKPAKPADRRGRKKGYRKAYGGVPPLDWKESEATVIKPPALKARKRPGVFSYTKRRRNFVRVKGYGQKINFLNSEMSAPTINVEEELNDVQSEEIPALPAIADLEVSNILEEGEILPEEEVEILPEQREVETLQELGEGEIFQEQEVEISQGLGEVEILQEPGEGEILPELGKSEMLLEQVEGDIMKDEEVVVISQEQEEISQKVEVVIEVATSSKQKASTSMEPTGPVRGRKSLGYRRKSRKMDIQDLPELRAVWNNFLDITPPSTTETSAQLEPVFEKETDNQIMKESTMEDDKLLMKCTVVVQQANLDQLNGNSRQFTISKDKEDNIVEKTPKKVEDVLETSHLDQNNRETTIKDTSILVVTPNLEKVIVEYIDPLGIGIGLSQTAVVSTNEVMEDSLDEDDKPLVERSIQEIPKKKGRPRKVVRRNNIRKPKKNVESNNRDSTFLVGNVDAFDSPVVEESSETTVDSKANNSIVEGSMTSIVTEVESSLVDTPDVERKRLSAVRGRKSRSKAKIMVNGVSDLFLAETTPVKKRLSRRESSKMSANLGELKKEKLEVEAVVSSPDSPRRRSGREVKMTAKFAALIQGSCKKLEMGGEPVDHFSKMLKRRTSLSSLHEGLQALLDSCVWEPGQLVWGYVDERPFWPSIVIPDPFNGDQFKYVKAVGLGTEMWVHIQFLHEGGRRAWITASSPLPFLGLDDFQALHAKDEWSCSERFCIEEKVMKSWSEAVKEGEMLASKSPLDRLVYIRRKTPLERYADFTPFQDECMPVEANSLTPLIRSRNPRRSHSKPTPTGVTSQDVIPKSRRSRSKPIPSPSVTYLDAIPFNVSIQSPNDISQSALPKPRRSRSKAIPSPSVDAIPLLPTSNITHLNVSSGSPNNTSPSVFSKPRRSRSKAIPSAGVDAIPLLPTTNITHINVSLGSPNNTSPSVFPKQRRSRSKAIPSASVDAIPLLPVPSSTMTSRNVSPSNTSLSELPKRSLPKQRRSKSKALLSPSAVSQNVLPSLPTSQNSIPILPFTSLSVSSPSTSVSALPPSPATSMMSPDDSILKGALKGRRVQSDKKKKTGVKRKSDAVEDAESALIGKLMKKPLTERAGSVVSIDSISNASVSSGSSTSLQWLQYDEKQALKFLFSGLGDEKSCDICLSISEETPIQCTQCYDYYHPQCLSPLGVKATSSKSWSCHLCVSQKNICFICRSSSGIRQRCLMSGCGKYYHQECLKLFPQTKFNLGQRKNRGLQREDATDTTDPPLEILICALHTCHHCASSNPAEADLVATDKLVRCTSCPTAYHSGKFCIPAGSEIISTCRMICGKHYNSGKEKTQRFNISWCFICCKGGSLICCDRCPSSIHLDCLKLADIPEGGYVCDECESGRFPLFGELVWAKLSNYRWWPAKVIYPQYIPENLKSRIRKQFEFTVQFYGSHDYQWLNRDRTFVFQEGDALHAKCGKGRYNDLFRKAVEEASQDFRIRQEALLAMEDLKVGGRNNGKPPPYVKIKTNKMIAKMGVVDEDGPQVCSCNPSDDEPCGPQSNCLNRMLLIECNPNHCPAATSCLNQQFQKRQYPPLKTFRTADRGWGLTSKVDLEKGQFVIEYVGEVIDEVEYKIRSEKRKAVKETCFYFLSLDQNRVIDAGSKGNLARFINHSCAPNCVTQKWNVNGVTRIGLFALEVIPARTEITFNYNLECEQETVCMCNQPQCKGFIGSTKGAKAEKKVEYKIKRKSSVKRRKGKVERRVSKTVDDTECLTCGKGGELMVCDAESCSRVSHPACAGLEEWPNEPWFCQRHQCSICLRTTKRCCSVCGKAFCSVHTKSNIMADPETGVLLCAEHVATKPDTRGRNCAYLRRDSADDKNKSLGLEETIVLPTVYEQVAIVVPDEDLENLPPDYAEEWAV